jgi:hypothetical protein
MPLLDALVEGLNLFFKNNEVGYGSQVHLWVIQRQKKMSEPRYKDHIESLSNHTPILLTTSTLKPLGNLQFKFEIIWPHHDP